MNNISKYLLNSIKLVQLHTIIILVSKKIRVMMSEVSFNYI